MRAAAIQPISHSGPLGASRPTRLPRTSTAGKQGPCETAGLGLQAAVAQAPLAQHHQIPVAALLGQVAHEAVGGRRIPRQLEPPPVRPVNAHSQSVEPAMA